MPKWWNRQTQRTWSLASANRTRAVLVATTKNPLGETSCRFKSGLGHHYALVAKLVVRVVLRGRWANARVSSNLTKSTITYAEIAQSVGGASLRNCTVWVRIPLTAPHTPSSGPCPHYISNMSAHRARIFPLNYH